MLALGEMHFEKSIQVTQTNIHKYVYLGAVDAQHFFPYLLIKGQKIIYSRVKYPIYFCSFKTWVLQ